MSREGIVFFRFFLKELCLIRDPNEMRAPENSPLAARRCGVPPKRSKFREEMMCCESKNDFFQKSGACLI
jgi:hypothetical protein